MLYGSRNQWVTPEKDNAAFARFAAEHAEYWRRLGPGRHFGEWYGAGIGRRYGLDHKRLALFNVDRFKNGLPEGLPANVELVPVRGLFDMTAIQAVIDKLYAEGSVLVPGWKKPEGVIIQVAGLRWKVTDNGDVHKHQTWTHQEAVKEGAAADRTKREKEETALDRAMRRVRVTRWETGRPGQEFAIEALNDGDFVITDLTQWCGKEQIASMRRVVAQSLMDAEAAS